MASVGAPNAKWLLAIGALWFVLVALAELEATRDLAVALAWLIAVSALILLFDPAGVDLAGSLGIKAKGITGNG